MAAISSLVGVFPVPIAPTGSYAIAVLVAVAPRGTEPASWVLQTVSALPTSRSDKISPMQMIAVSPARHAAWALAATAASVSP